MENALIYSTVNAILGQATLFTLCTSTARTITIKITDV